MKSCLTLLVVVLSVFALVQPNAAFLDFLRNFGRPHKGPGPGPESHERPDSHEGPNSHERPDSHEGPDSHEHHRDRCFFECQSYNQTNSSTASNSSQVGCDFLGVTVPSEFGLSYISDCCTTLSTCYNTCDNKEETCCQAFWSCLDCNNSINQNTTQTSEMELINQEVCRSFTRALLHVTKTNRCDAYKQGQQQSCNCQ